MPQCTKTGEYKSVQCRGSQCYCVTKTGQRVEGTDVDQDKKPVCPGEAKQTRKERNVLFNDALNTFYLRLYGVTYMVKDHSDRLLVPISSKGSSICINPQDRIAHTTAFVLRVVEHWLEREIAQ